jgi:hypothetical protein
LLGTLGGLGWFLHGAKEKDCKIQQRFVSNINNVCICRETFESRKKKLILSFDFSSPRFLSPVVFML